jgi:hypothetical protein
MAFARGVDDAPSPPTPLRLVVRTSTDRAGYLGLAGTLPEHRGKGARGARRQAEQLLSQHPAPGIP